MKGYQDCYDISESLPQTALNRNPMKKRFGRQMMFFHCADVSCGSWAGLGEILTVFTI